MNEKTESKKGGKRAGAGRPAGTKRGVKELAVIKIEKSTFDLIKKLKKAKTYNHFLLDIIKEK